MNCFRGFVRLSFIILLVFVVSIVGQPVFAALITTGEVFPVDPSTWDPSITAYVGIGGTGSVIADAGTSIASDWGYLGYGPGSTGEVTINGAGSTWASGKFSVGSYGNGRLNITDGGAVTNSGRAVNSIGRYFGSTGEVNVDGAGSRWETDPPGYWCCGRYYEYRSDLYVGYEGDGVLNITDGGLVKNARGIIGLQYDSTGQVTVDGAGSTFINSEILEVGFKGDGILNITDGGLVDNGMSMIGIQYDSTGQVTVDGAGSTFINSGWLYVGNSGEGTMNITGGGVASNTDANIGMIIDSTGQVTVDGAGSTWTNSGELNVGWQGNGTLTIANGGAVSVAEDTWVARESGSSGSIHFAGGTLTTGGFWGASDDLSGTGTINAHGIVSGGDLVFDSTHGLNQTFAMNKNAGQNITVNLDVDGSAAMGAGYGGEGTMSVSDGVVVDSTRGYIGYKSGSTGQVTVDGAGSTWNSGVLDVGRYGDGKLNVTGGGAVSSSAGVLAVYESGIGCESGSTGEATVDGAGSTWNSGLLDVGRYGNGKLNITGGGLVKSKGYRSGDIGYHSSIGRNSGSTGEVTVDGAGSCWGAYDTLNVGYYGDGTLNITDGGSVRVGTTFVAREPGSSGSIHFDGGRLSTGGFLGGVDDLSGTGTINADGIVTDLDIVLGSGPIILNKNPGQNITINVGDGGSVMGAGYAGSGTMGVFDRSVNSLEGYIGYKSGSTGEMTIDGDYSSWECPYLEIGHYGNGKLNVTGGAAIRGSSRFSSYRGRIYIGHGLGSPGELTIGQSGSEWSYSGELCVGNSGDGKLNITDGGLFKSGTSRIGIYGPSTGEVTVDGVGSTWENIRLLDIGYMGKGTLNVTGGGVVKSYGNTGGVIGNSSSSTGEVTVEGTGSTWTNGLKLTVGRYGDGTLNITDSGLVSVVGQLLIDKDGDGDSFVNMATGGMLALRGEADESIGQFLGLVAGTDAIRYWDGASWAHISGATAGSDYTLEYLTGGELTGFTMLTVGAVPEPSTIVMILVGLGTLLAVRRRR
jgi:T5SS/PEP-CTERM-associated repeat protein